MAVSKSEHVVEFTANPARLIAVLDAIARHTEALASELRGLAAEGVGIERTDEAQQILDLPMDDDNEANATTVRDYLVALLATLWREGEAFDGKKPFGNSGWTDDLDTALARAGLVEATFDDDGYLEDVDREKADELIHSAIRALGSRP